MNGTRFFAWRRLLAAVAVALLIGAAGAAGEAAAQQGATREGGPVEGREVGTRGPTGGAVPGNALGRTSDSEIWRQIRRGAQGQVSIPDRQAGVLIQSEGETWRVIRNGPLKLYGAWLLLGIVGLLALFFLVRGRIKIDSGWSGRTIERFNDLDRFVHWMTAVSFIVLALTGINLLWGRTLLLPLLGSEAFTLIAQAGKYAHNYLAFPFMLGVLLMFVLWVRHNIPNKYDLIWLAKGGGLFVKGVHPPSRKFNAGQKVIFWAVVLGGLSLALSGIGLLFPFQTSMWGKTAEALTAVGLDVAAITGLDLPVTPMLEQQLNSLWHAVVALVMIAIILAHIYIGSIGMQGAFTAMGSGKVDENWAREHHNIWVAEVTGESPSPRQGHPAE